MELCISQNIHPETASLHCEKKVDFCDYALIREGIDKLSRDNRELRSLSTKRRKIIDNNEHRGYHAVGSTNHAMPENLAPTLGAPANIDEGKHLYSVAKTHTQRAKGTAGNLDDEGGISIDFLPLFHNDVKKGISQSVKREKINVPLVPVSIDSQSSDSSFEISSSASTIAPVVPIKAGANMQARSELLHPTRKLKDKVQAQCADCERNYRSLVEAGRVEEAETFLRHSRHRCEGKQTFDRDENWDFDIKE